MWQNKIIKDTSISTIGVSLTAVIAAVQAIVVAKILGPKSYGELTVYRLVLSYTVFCDIGILWAMVRDISFYRGQQEHKKLSLTKNVAFTINLISTTIVSLVIVLYFMFFETSIQTEIVDILILGAIILVQGFFVFSRNYLVAEKQFVERAIFIVIFPLFNLIFILFIGNSLNLRSVLIAMLCAYLLSLLYGFKKKVFNIAASFEKNTIKRLVGMGAPIFGNGLLSIMTNSVDRIMIIYFLPITQLGYYGIAAMIKAFMDGIYRTIFLTLFPNVTERYGETNDIESIKKYVWIPIVTGAYIAPLMFGSVILIIPSVIHIILPKYTEGILATQIVVASSFFGFIQVGLINFFITINKLYRTYPHRIGALIFCVITSWITIANGWGIEGVATCYLLTTALLAGLLTLEFYRQYNDRWKTRIVHLSTLFFPFCTMCLTLYFTSLITVMNGGTTIGIVSNTVLQVIAFILLNTPLIMWLNHRYCIVKTIKFKMDE